MALSRSSALLSTAAEVVDLTGVQDLANLETGSEFSVADSLLRAHEWVFDMVEQALGPAAPARLSNQTRLERAVAARFLEVLYANGYLGDDPGGSRDYWAGEARDEVKRFRPVYSDSGDAPAASSQGIPVVGTFRRGWRSSGAGTERYDVWFPDRRRR